MSRGSWRLCPISSISIAKLEEDWTDLQTGYLDSSPWPDCDLFAPKAVVQAAFGYRVNVSRNLGRLLSDPRFHRHELRNGDGRLVGLITAQQSVAWLGGLMTAEAADRSRDNLRRGPATVCSTGSNIR
jgi:hypothetical protein